MKCNLSLTDLKRADLLELKVRVRAVLALMHSMITIAMAVMSLLADSTRLHLTEGGVKATLME